MANKYSSNVRTVNARNVYTGNLNPPNDLAIAYNNYRRQYFDLQPTISVVGTANPSDSFMHNVNTSFFIHRIGIFSNFADGLVFKRSGGRLNAFIEAIGMELDTEYPEGADTITVDSTSQTVTGVGTSFLTDFVSGDILFLPHSVAGQLVEISAIDNDTTMYLRDYPFQDHVYMAANPLGLVSAASLSDGVIVRNIPAFNTMIDVNQLLAPANFFDSTSVNSFIRVTLYTDNNFFDTPSLQPDLEFLTSTISTAFVNENVFFDVLADIELTQR